MADIVAEIESLSEFVTDISAYGRIWKQFMPAKYSPNELSIRYMGDTTESETGYHYRLDREYQFVYFGTSELDCIQRATVLQRKFNNAQAIPLKDSTRYLRNGSFSVSPPFKTEGGEVYAVIGILRAEVREAREFVASPKMAVIETSITRD